MARGIAAVAVVAFHSNPASLQFGGPQLSWLRPGEHGVDFFFVLSGFIIYMAHARDVGRPNTVRNYLLKRAIRLVPLLWLVVGGCLLARLAAGLPADPMMIARSMILWPSIEPTTPVVIWTLRHEAMFYLAFAFFIFRPAAGKALCVIWTLAVFTQGCAILAGHPVRGWASLIVSAYSLDFLLGVSVAVLHARDRLPTHPRTLWLAIVALIAAFFCERQFGLHRAGQSDYLSLTSFFWTGLLGLLFSWALAGLVASEHRMRIPRVAVLFGGASYAIYLVHVPINSVVQRLIVPLPASLRAWGFGHFLVIGAGVVAGVILHLALERPVTGWLRRNLLNRNAVAGTSREGIAERI
jgi:peptidoglycan/LPS O-acetylase OafA/YrhL